MSTAIAIIRLTLLSHLTFRMNDFTCWKWFVSVYSSRQSASWLVVKLHFGTFVSRTLPYTSDLYRSLRIRLTAVPFFSQQFSDSFVCRSNERMTKCKSVNLLFFSPCLCCSNRKRVQLNMFSLSSLISQFRKSVVRCCLQYPISFAPFNGKSVVHLFQTIIW